MLAPLASLIGVLGVSMFACKSVDDSAVGINRAA